MKAGKVKNSPKRSPKAPKLTFEFRNGWQYLVIDTMIIIGSPRVMDLDGNEPIECRVWRQKIAVTYQNLELNYQAPSYFVKGVNRQMKKLSETKGRIK